jgi:hypothetical protein
VFEASLRALRRLNALGYGREGSGLLLNLVYNPQGPSLPPPQAALQADYKRHLGETTTASSSTNCSPWPTCRSSASAAC